MKTFSTFQAMNTSCNHFSAALLAALTIAVVGQSATAASLPSPTTLPATGVLTTGTNVSATLNGSVNPNGLATLAWFEYGTSARASFSTAPVSVGSGSTPATVTNQLINLAPQVVYHYRLVASNSLGLVHGMDRQFTPLLLTLTGSSPITHPAFTPFVDPGATLNPPPAPGIGAGYEHSVVLRADGTVLGWGRNQSGQATGVATPSPATGVVMVAGQTVSNVVAIAVGYAHNLALKTDGTVVGWGENNFGKANGANAGSGVVDIAAGQAHSLALKSDGTVVGWGAANHGQTNGAAAGSNVVAIAAGGFHNLALKADGTVVAWGAGTNNTGADPHYGQAAVPTGATNVVAISAGYHHSAALRADGTILSWGLNTSGQTNTSSATNMQAISSFYHQTLALRTNGTIAAWGSDWSGQNRETMAGSNVVALAAGAYHSLVAKANGGLLSWGISSYGQTNVPANWNAITLSVAVTGTVDVNLNGTYELTYTVTNAAGATAKVTRSVFVPLSLAGHVYAGASGLPGISVAALREWQDFPTHAVPLPDFSTNHFPMSVQGSNLVGTVEVRVDIAHSFRGDLQLSLIHTFGTNRTEVLLKDWNIDEDFADLSTTYASLRDLPGTEWIANLGSFHGQPMSGEWSLRIADVFQGDAGTLNHWSLRLGLAPAITGGDGGFRFENLDGSHAYTVQPLSSTFAFTPSAISDVTTSRQDLDFALFSAPISGRVLSGGTGLGGVRVTATSVNNTTFSVLTDSNGYYLLPSLAQGVYQVAPFLAGHTFAPASAGVSAGATNVDFSVATFSISGRIINSFGSGVSGVTVGNGTTEVTTDLDGYYLFAAVTPGPWTVTPVAERTSFAPASRDVTVGPTAVGQDFGVLSSPPAISAIADRVIPANTNTGPIRFTVNDGETAAGFLKVSAVSSNPDLIPSMVPYIVVEGAGEERALVITPVSNHVGTAVITLTVTDGSLLSSSVSFALRVNARPVAGLGTALAFGGSGDAVQVNTNGLPFKGDFAVEAWVFAPTNANDGTARSVLGQGTSAAGFSLGYNNQGLLCLGTNWTTAVPFPFGDWHHLAIVRDAADTRLYLDGIHCASRGSAIAHPAQPGHFFLGAQPDGTNEFWLGALDEVRVWHRALSADEIQQGTNRIVFAGEAGLAGLWRLDDRAGTNAMDRSGQGFHGTLVGNPQWIPATVVFNTCNLPEDNAVTDFLPAFDADGDPLYYAIVNPGEKGEAVLCDTNSLSGDFTYTPKPNINGPDRFSFLVSDGFEESDLAVITVNILADTNPPMIQPITDYVTAEEQPITIPFTALDLETAASNLVLTAESGDPVVVPGTNIVFDASGTNVTITPATNQFGTNISITLSVFDGQFTSSRTFRLTVTNVNDAPVISGLPANLFLPRDSTNTVNFTVSDVDNAASHLTVGAWSSNSGLVSVLSTNGTAGNRGLTLRTSGTSSSATQYVTLTDGTATVTNAFTVTVNDLPVITLSSLGRKAFANQPANPIEFTVSDTETPAVTILDAGFYGSANGPVHSLCVQNNGWILAGGAFTTLSGTARTNLGRLYGDGAIDSGSWSGKGANGPVYALAIQALTDRILVGGSFSTLDGTAAKSLGMLDGSLGKRYPTSESLGVNGSAYALAAQSDGKLLVGRSASTTNYDVGNNPWFFPLSRLNLDGLFDSQFNIRAKDTILAGNPVYALAIQTDGKILVGSQSGVHRLQTNGYADSGFSVQSADGPVYALAVQSNGKIMVGGAFTRLWGVTRQRIARLNANGTLDTTFNPGADGTVHALAVQADGQILVGGSFTTLSGITRQRIGRLNANGTLDLEFNPGANGTVRCLASQSDGKIVVGGEFTAISGVARDRIVRLNATPTRKFSFAASSSNPTLVAGFSYGGDGGSRALTVIPASNQVGTATITLTVTDGDGNSVSTNFDFNVAPLPRYELIDLGTSLGGSFSYAYGINDMGQVVGSADFSGSTRAFLWDPKTMVMTNLGVLAGGSYSYAQGVNDLGQVVGGSVATAGGRAFLWQTNIMTMITNSESFAYGINDHGQVVGEAYFSGSTRAFLWDSNTKGMTNLGVLSGGSNSIAKGINEHGQVVGRCNAGGDRAFLWQTNLMRELGVLPGANSVIAYGINAQGQVVGYCYTPNGWRALLWETNDTVTSLGTLPGSFFNYSHSFAYGINNQGLAVGYVQLDGPYRAVAYVDGAVLDLNAFLSADSEFSVLTQARAVNDLGAIVGYGTMKSGGTHAFLLQPQWIIGEPLPIPPGAIDPNTGRPYRAPDFTSDLFVWAQAEGKLYPVRPGLAQVSWYDTAELYVGTNAVAPKFVSGGFCSWPEYPQIHVAGAPVQLEIGNAPVYRFVNLEYTDCGADADASTKTFTSTNVGYSVIRYLVTPAGEPPNATIHPSYFQVVRTVAWNDPKYWMDQVPATVGQKVSDPSPRIPSARSGYVLKERAYYDGFGPDAAYDRAAQTGPIIPVNATDRPDTEDDLVVAFYHPGPTTGADWPDLPVRFKVSWPTNTEKIVIASETGTGPLDPAQYRDMQIYNQPDPNLAGFNPNEEHALFAPLRDGQAGQALFALRNDLNSAWGFSTNFVLLKYRPPETNEWRMKLFQVLAEDGTHRFRYTAEAGQEIQPPYPLTLLPTCPDSTVAVSGPFHRDYAGRIYARAADQPGQPDPTIAIRYFYSLQPDFYYHTQLETNIQTGDCIAWLDHRLADNLSAPNASAGTRGTPLDVTYAVSWPTNVPTLQMGETLLTAKRGLPGIMNFANAEVVYDPLNPDGTSPLSAAARLFDPLSARVLAITNVAGVSAGYQFPSSINLQNAGGQKVFTDLPYVLRSRLTYDPMARTLSFKGILDESGLGEPLLLPNILSARERDRIKQLSAEPRFQTIIEALYRLTRNPNQVHTAANVTRKADLVAADDLLIGCINQFTLKVKANVSINYLKAGTPEISVTELRRLEQSDAVTTVQPNVTVCVRASKANAPTNFVQVGIALESFGNLPKALTAGLPVAAPAPGEKRYLTVVENDNQYLGGRQVNLKLIAIEGGPFKGDVKIIYPDNVFDQRLTLRHSLDFAGEPENAEFEWFYHPDTASFTPTELPTMTTNGQITNPKGWHLFNALEKQGMNDITLGDGNQASLFTLEDNWFVLRYRYTTGGQTNWSEWIGDPAAGATPRAILAEGWIKRVIKGLNPFEARVKDFHNSPVSTYASMLMQAGQRYEGDVPLNPDPDSINSVGLIETYETVLRRGRDLSIDGVPSVSSDGANNALLLAAGRIADLYMLLGNEAFADASDPLITFTTESGVYGSLASSIFTFQNQLDSLLDEELALLRGRDDKAAGVGARPVYNRLIWNFTTAEGEVAYSQTYNLTDQNQDGVIDEYDARLLYPQGHGDAWGHYLSATKSYYGLLRHPRYIWIPRAEAIVVGGAAVQVDFLDERKFAKAAAAKARTGAQLVDLTYRASYVDDPAGQWQGYKDPNTDRAWGVTEWARRAGQGAYFDWLTANAVLPAQDQDTNHAGLQQIDRTTVVELDEILAQYQEIQELMNRADTGLNPLGLAKGVVSFDIDPNEVANSGRTHFEQVQGRAVKMMNNAVLAWNEANQMSQALRRNQDTVNDLTRNVDQQERDYKNRLIELFGYPYDGDIGPAGTYPSGYDGPDIYHYMYVETVELSGETAPPSPAFTGFFKPNFGIDVSIPSPDRKSLWTWMQIKDQSGWKEKVDMALGKNGNFWFPEDSPQDPGSRLEGSLLEVAYPRTAADYGFTAPSHWGGRRAPGEIQMALSDLVQSQARFKQALLNYDNLILKIEARRDSLQGQYNIKRDEVKIRNDATGEQYSLETKIKVAKKTAALLGKAREQSKGLMEAIVEGIPKVVGMATDALSAVRGAIKRTGSFVSTLMGWTIKGLEMSQSNWEGQKSQLAQATQESIDALPEQERVREALRALEELIREEAVLRVEAFAQREALSQSAGRYQAAVARGLRLLDERTAFRRNAAGDTQGLRYRDMAFRIFRNDALQKYRAQFDLAARYVYLAATAYDYEVNLLGDANGSGREFLTDIIRQRSLGQMRDGVPVVGGSRWGGLADPLARMGQNFEVLKGQLGFNTPETETGRFSLRSELFRVRPVSTNASAGASRRYWQDVLKNSRVQNLWDVPEFRRYCRPFAPESAGPQPGIVIRFPTTVTFGLNYFGWPLSGGDSAYDSSRFATKVRSAGVWFSDYDGAGLSVTPRVYLVPVGADVLRAPAAGDFVTREWKVIDQVIPVPFVLGPSQFREDDWIPMNDSLNDSLIAIRRFASFRAYHDAGFTPAQMTSDTRLIGRSVWNTEWLLIIPGGTFLNDPDDGLARFIDTVSDIKLFFQTYSYPGN